MTSTLQVTFGQRVRELRETHDWTQAELAKRVQIHQPDLCDIEKGRHAPTLETVEKFAKAFGVNADALLT